MTARLHETGEFCWFNILTRKPANARECVIRRLTYLLRPASWPPHVGL